MGARAKTIAAGVAAWLAAGAAAQAHSPYLLPNAFDLTGRDHVTVEASFTEHMFTPDVVMKSDDFHAVGPDGGRIALTPVYGRDLALLELATPGSGTWRITSGERTGRTAKAAFSGGKWVFLEPGKPAPAGAKPVDMQSLTKAETYVSRCKPTEAALAPTGHGLEFHALTHPDAIGAGEPARFEVLLDGKPVAGQAISLARGGEAYADARPLPDVTSDAQGRFTLVAPTPGVYLAMTRVRLPPVGDGPARSLTYALTFEAAR